MPNFIQSKTTLATLLKPVILAIALFEIPSLSGLQPSLAVAQEADVIVMKPGNAIELMRNIKVAMDRDLLIREDFYTEKTLKRFFGGDEISWTKREPTGSRRGSIRKFEALIAPAIEDHKQRDGLLFYFIFDNQRQGKLSSSLNLKFYSVDPPSFSDIERIFGAKWKLDDALADTPHRKYKMATHPHGNETFIYSDRDRLTNRTAIFQFFFDGTLNTADFDVESN